MDWWRRRPAVLVGTIVALGMLAAGAAAALPAGPRDNPRLAPGAHVLVAEAGFARRANVTVGLVGDRLVGSTLADGKGRVRYRFTVPRTIRAGQHALIFAGTPAHVTKAAERGTAVVLVPLVRVWRFRVSAGPTSGTSNPPSAPASAPASGGTAESAAASAAPAVSGSGSGAQGRSGPTADTGADLRAAISAAGLALLLGTALLIAGRRRKRRAGGDSATTQPPSRAP